ncbi:exodeoxyribonuclease VII small subunit [Arsenicicoccus dermatophilus]|uniref:exodeoxyribonuclease VII small subunit n=1 Tax=Arsenicicoccus dermatophilus TaxID=1076331 RepID=UPI0039171EFE
MAEQTPATERPVDELTYEAARDELVSIVSRLEAGQLPLEESLRVWERGEALAAHCASFLDRAEAHLAAQDAETAAGQG